MRRGLAWLVLSLVLLHAASLAAQRNAASPTSASGSTKTTATTVPADDEGLQRRWYGWQILATDVSALAIGVAIGAESEDEGDRRFGDVVASAWGLGALGSISVHAAHENGATAIASFADRMLLPPLVSVIGLGVGCLASDIAHNCASDSARWSFAIGALGASAIDAGLMARERPHDAHQWYGWQMLVIDGAAFGGGVIAAARKHEPDRDKRAGIVLAFPYVAGILISPWVHAFHGRWGVALGSLAMRAFLPFVGALPGLIGYCAATGGVHGCIGDGAIYGVLGGTLITAAIDIGLLAQERVQSASPATAFAPYLAPREGGFSAGMAGAF